MQLAEESGQVCAVSWLDDLLVFPLETPLQAIQLIRLDSLTVLKLSNDNTWSDFELPTKPNDFSAVQGQPQQPLLELCWNKLLGSKAVRLFLILATRAIEALKKKSALAAQLFTVK